MTVRILVKKRSGGIYLDAKILHKLIKKSVIVALDDDDIDYDLTVDFNIHVEHIFENFKATTNYWLVNHEFIYEWDIKNLSIINIALCKTQVAMEVMKKFNVKTQYVGFMSMIEGGPIKYISNKDKPRLFVHFAGSSPMKNTMSLIHAWEMSGIPAHLFITYAPGPKHSQIQFTEVATFEGIVCKKKGTIYHAEHLSLNDINKLRSIADVYICPSIMEGYGHYLVEGIIGKKLVITTDAAPMNEFIDANSGILVKTTGVIKVNNVMKLNWIISDCIGYTIDIPDLARAIVEAYNMPYVERKKKAVAAYNKYVKNVKKFKKTLVKICS